LRATSSKSNKNLNQQKQQKKTELTPKKIPLKKKTGLQKIAQWAPGVTSVHFNTSRVQALFFTGPKRHQTNQFRNMLLKRTQHMKKGSKKK